MGKRQQVYPEWRKTTPVRVEPGMLRSAEQLIDGCETCAMDSEIPFDYILDQVTGCDPESTDYVLSEPARCPRCGGLIRSGFWRWYSSEEEGRKVFILPGTLVKPKN